jgi:hypothetical protein
VLQNAELVTVIAIQAITSGYPDKAVTILEYLRRETTGHLFVGIERLTHLGMYAQEKICKEKQQRITLAYSPVRKNCMFHVL